MPKTHKVYNTKKKGPIPGKGRRRGAKPYCKAVSGQPIKGKLGGKYYVHDAAVNPRALRDNQDEAVSAGLAASGTGGVVGKVNIQGYTDAGCLYGCHWNR